MAIEIVDFPINSMVIFHSKMLVHQRVYPVDMTNDPHMGRFSMVSSNLAHTNGESPDTIEHSSKPSVVSLYWLRTGFL